MAKTKSVFFCTQCGYESSGWLGKCPGCGEWNTFVEEPAERKNAGGNSFGFSAGFPGSADARAAKPVRIDDIAYEKGVRDSSGIGELDRVMGGGIVRGSLVLVAGDPGIGKSTLMLMISGYLAQNSGTVLYVSGEESESQIKMRAERLHHVKIDYYDERLTTVMAEKVLIEADVSRRKRKEVIDKQAAVIILQSWLDSHPL